MGTVFTIEAYGVDENLLRSSAAECFEEVRRLDRMLSNYRPDSELSRANDCAADAPVKLSREAFDLLSACIRYSRESEGAFDVTVGPLLKLWGFYSGRNRVPSRAEVRKALEAVGYQNLVLDPATSTLRFRKQRVELDPGGVGKGYAVDRLVTMLRARGVSAALVSAGGSSIYGLGVPPDDPRGWPIRILDPRDQTRSVGQVYLRDQSLSTSGSYEKFFWANDRVYSHIMDPRTGYPATGMIAVSVIAPKTLDSEVWAKPYFVLGRRWTERHKPANFQVLICEDKASAACAWLP